MFNEKLKNAWRKNNSMIAVGLDTDLLKLPSLIHKFKDPIFQFNREIIDATADLVCSYKFQIAYYSAQRAEDQLAKTIQYLRENYPELPIVLDAKRGDIREVSEMYAREAFERYEADALTVNPYLGTDSLKPFLDRKDRGVIVVCATSNPGSAEFQDFGGKNKSLFLSVAKKAVAEWNYNQNVLLVVGANNPTKMKEVRDIAAEINILVPGIGAQNGNLEETVRVGRAKNDFGLILSASRSVIYASSSDDFAKSARRVVEDYQSRANKVI